MKPVYSIKLLNNVIIQLHILLIVYLLGGHQTTQKGRALLLLDLLLKKKKKKVDINIHLKYIGGGPGEAACV